jgi:hypothetical protein
MTEASVDRPEKSHWLDRKENVAKVYRGVWALCGLLLVAEPFVHKHPEVEIESWFGFYSWFGFVGCVGLVLVAKALRVILKRREDYYDR